MKRQLLVTALLLVLVVFSVGVIVGNLWHSSENTQASRVLRQSELDAESFLVEQELFETLDTSCQLSERRMSELNQELWNLGQVLGETNAREQLGQDNYHFLKRKYHLLQTRTYILAKKLQDDCGQQANIILYYFNQNDPGSLTQGRVLDELAKQHNLHIYAIEYDYSRELRFLQEYYAIERAPALVINYEHVLEGLSQPRDIVPLLHGQS